MNPIRNSSQIMKKLILNLFFTTVSLYAMDQSGGRIESFDFEKHGEGTLLLLPSSYSDDMLTWNDSPTDFPFVMIDNNSNEVIGFILQSINKHQYKEFFHNHRNLPTNLQTSEFTEAYITYLKVHPERQTKGRGTALLNHVEKNAKEQNCALLSLMSLNKKNTDFYLKRKYVHNPACPHYMVKPLSDEMKICLESAHNNN